MLLTAVCMISLMVPIATFRRTKFSTAWYTKAFHPLVASWLTVFSKLTTLVSSIRWLRYSKVVSWIICKTDSITRFTSTFAVLHHRDSLGLHRLYYFSGLHLCLSFQETRVRASKEWYSQSMYQPYVWLPFSRPFYVQSLDQYRQRTRVAFSRSLSGYSLWVIHPVYDSTRSSWY